MIGRALLHQGGLGVGLLSIEFRKPCQYISSKVKTECCLHYWYGIFWVLVWHFSKINNEFLPGSGCGNKNTLHGTRVSKTAGKFMSWNTPLCRMVLLNIWTWLFWTCCYLNNLDPIRRRTYQQIVSDASLFSDESVIGKEKWTSMGDILFYFQMWMRSACLRGKTR